MGMIARASQDPEAALPVKPAWARRGIMPLFSGAGFLVSRVVECLPADASLSIQDRIFKALASDYHTPFDALRAPLERVRAAMRQAEQDARKSAALLTLLSHPPAQGDAAALNVEMVRQAVLAMRFLRARACRPRLVIAIDDFALDMLTLHEEGLYAGFVAGSHLGLNRAALRHSFSGASFMRRTALDLMPWRLFSRLAAGGEVGMVLSGGVPATGRALYVLREWIKEIWRRHPIADAGVARRLLEENQDFKRFEAALPRGSSLRKNIPRLCEGWAASRALGLRENSPARGACSLGRLDEPTEDALRVILRAAGAGETESAARIGALAEEFARETPFRRRFFRLLLKRVLARSGRPIVFVPISHDTGDESHLRCGEGWVWRGQKGGRILAVRAAEKEERWEGTADEFAARFVSESFA